MSNTEQTSPAPIAPLHVLHLVPADAYRRFGRMFRQLGLALEEEGFRVSLASDDARLIADVETSPIQGCPVRAFSGWRALGLERELSRAVEEPVDFFHVWGLDALPAARRLTRDVPKPVLVHLSTLAELDAVTRRPLRVGEYLAVACARHAQWLRTRRRGAAAIVSVIEPGLLAPQVPAGKRPDDRIAGMLWLARPETSSSMQLLLDTIGSLRKANFEVQTVIAASGAAGGRLWRMARQRSLQDCITILDDELLWDQKLRAFDVCTIPASQSELSLAPLLAMAMGETVICSREQLAEWFRPEETVINYQTGDAMDLAQQIQRVLDRQPWVAAIARTATAYVRQHHSLSRMASRLIELYSTLVDDWRRSPARDKVSQ